jgi:hypothetical protein
MPYVIRLFDGSTHPSHGWIALEAELAAACGLSIPELRLRVGADAGAPAGVGPDTAPLTVNATIGRLWWDVYIPDPPRFCTRRVRRHTARTFAQWEDWKGDPPDEPGGDSLP